MHSSQERDLCEACELELPRIRHACQRCCIELPPHGESTCCADCLFGKHFVRQIIAPYSYVSPISHWVVQFKSARHVHYARVFAELIAEAVFLQYSIKKAKRPQLLLPVPLTGARFKKRGFNQAELLARFLGELLEIPVGNTYAIKIQDRFKQSHLGVEERLKNVENVFEIVKSLPEHVAIVDDVVTTCATLESLAKICLQHGAKIVDVYAICRRQKMNA